jgi:serine/threonine protein kinase
MQFDTPVKIRCKNIERLQYRKPRFLYENFKVQKRMGSGSEGAVFKVSSNGHVFALKVWYKKRLARTRYQGGPEQMDTVVAEFDMRKSLGTKNDSRAKFFFPRYYAVYENTEFYYKDGGRYDGGVALLTELVIGQNLIDIPKTRLSLNEIVGVIVLGTLEAVETAHKAHVLHRDLKPANIMYDESRQQVALVDFGLACNVCQQCPISVARGVPCNKLERVSEGMAPEILTLRRLKLPLDSVDFHLADVYMVCKSLQTFIADVIYYHPHLDCLPLAIVSAILQEATRVQYPELRPALATLREKIAAIPHGEMDWDNFDSDSSDFDLDSIENDTDDSDPDRSGSESDTFTFDMLVEGQ